LRFDIFNFKYFYFKKYLNRKTAKPQNRKTAKPQNRKTAKPQNVKPQNVKLKKFT